MTIAGRGGRGVGCLAAWLILLGAAPANAAAQLPVGVWARPVLAVPIGDFAGRENGVAARASAGFDVGAVLSLGALRVYGEYQEVGFECGECAEAGVDDSVLDRGWGAGVIVPIDAESYGFAPWVRLGVIGHHLRFRSAEESAYSHQSLGWGAGVGASVRPLGPLRVEPSILFRGYDATFGFAIDIPDRDISVTYVAFGLSLVIER